MPNIGMFTVLAVAREVILYIFTEHAIFALNLGLTSLTYSC